MKVPFYFLSRYPLPCCFKWLHQAPERPPSSCRARSAKWTCEKKWKRHMTRGYCDETAPQTWSLLHPGEKLWVLEFQLFPLVTIQMWMLCPSFVQDCHGSTAAKKNVMNICLNISTDMLLLSLLLSWEWISAWQSAISFPLGTRPFSLTRNSSWEKNKRNFWCTVFEDCNSSRECFFTGKPLPDSFFVHLPKKSDQTALNGPRLAQTFSFTWGQ